jgi:cellulose synthase (UDP-forming)
MIFLAFILGCCNQLLGSSLPSETLSSAHIHNKEQAQNASRIGPLAVVQPGPYIPGHDAMPPDADNADSVVQVLGFKDMGLSQAIEMRGPHSYSSVNFTLPHNLVPRHATLRLTYSLDSSLDSHTASLKLILNGATIAVLPRSPNSELNGAFTEANLDIPADLLLRSNNFTFEFNGSGVMLREEQARARILCRISTGSALEVHGDRLRWQNDLSQLPLPLFDSELQTSTTVPFVFLSQPSEKTLEAAGIVASWFGLQSGSKPVRFATSIGQIPPGNAIIFSADRSALPSSLQIQAGTGPLLALRSSPSDPYGTVLVIAGDDEQQTLTAARTLSLTKRATTTSPPEGLPLSGDTAQIPDLVMPPVREKEDAPRWMSTDRTALLANCRTHENLESDGSTPIPLYFHVPPDLFYGERQNLKLHLYYRYNALQAASGSALRVIVNGNLVNEAILPPGTDFVDRQRLILVPVADLRPFGNTILFNFDFIPANRESTVNPELATLKGEILCNSSLDTHGLASWARMPNLELFADAGFPFTQLADLSETTVVLPSVPSAEEISLYLHFMGHFGAQTGYPALRVTVDGPNTVISKGRDYLILGTIANQPAFSSMDALLPVTFDSNGIHVKQAQNYFSYLSAAEVSSSHWWSGLMGNQVKEELPSNAGGPPDAMVEEIESPSALDRSIVLIALKEGSSSDAFAGVLLDRSHSGDIAGSVSVLRNLAFESYSLDGATYHVGNISWFAMMRIWLTQHFVLLLLVVTALSFVVALWTREWLSQRADERLKLAETFNAAH